MMRRLFVVIILLVEATGVGRSIAQPSPGTTLEEAARLDELARSRYEEGKFQEGVAPAQRALALREQTLGANHPDVAQSLNTLGLLHKAQGAYVRAQQL